MNRLLRKPFRLQYASNLFAYKGAENPASLLTTGVAPNLSLLGNTVSVETAADRWASREFLSFCANNWKRTLLVPAYSEMGCAGAAPAQWTDLIDELRVLLQEVNRESSGKVYLMDQSVMEFAEGVRVLGFTGWSSWSRSAQSPDLPNLYFTQKGKFTPSDGHELAKEDMDWLNRELILNNTSPTVLVSHGLSVSSLVQDTLPNAAYRQSDLLSFYPFPFLFSKERCIKACLGGAGIGGSVSGVIRGRFHAVNARKSIPAQKVATPSYRPDAFYEFSWMDKIEEDIAELVEGYARTISFPRGTGPLPLPAVAKIEMAMC
jgi:hypothetical protein